MFETNTYCLKYKDTTILEFDTKAQNVTVLNQNLLPVSIQNRACNYDMIRKFCSDRILVMNRKHCKELLTSCGLDNESDITICIACKGLSLRDNYWITSKHSNDSWKNVNLYHNNFCVNASKTALTGNISANVDLNKVCTAELTNKGTKAKCYYKDTKNHKIYLFKSETKEEINSEIISFYIAKALNINCSAYNMLTLFNKECSVCEIKTNENYELIPCRDLLSHYNTNTMHYTEEYYNLFLRYDPVNFIKMQVFDFITLNTDRNRDNFGLYRVQGNIVGLYPLFDHDSCFKGKGVNGIYFPSGITFSNTLELLKNNNYYTKIKPDIDNAKQIISGEKFKEQFIKYKTLEIYKNMLKRLGEL